MNKIPGPQTGYTDILDRATIEKLEDNKEKYYPLRPSSAGYCGRRLGYSMIEYLGIEDISSNVKPPSLDRLLNLGHSVEYSAIQNFKNIKEVQIKYKQQVVTVFTLEDGRLIEGSCDGVFWSDDHKGIFDIKSVKDGWSNAYSSRWQETLAKYKGMASLQEISPSAWYAESLSDFIMELGSDFLVDNLFQLNLYACSNFFLERGVDHAVIYKYNKNTSDHYEIRFKPDKAVADYVKSKFDLVNTKARENKVDEIPKDYNLGSLQCSFCPYATKCWGDTVNPTKEYFKTLPYRKWPKDSNRLASYKEIEAAFVEYKNADKEAEKRSRFEETLLTLMEKEDIMKLKLDDGSVWERKLLKSPRPHYELRRSKL